MNIASGLYATLDITADLLGAVKTGTRKMETFVKNAIEDAVSDAFIKPITKSGIKTFADMEVKPRGKVVKKSFSLSPEIMFRRGLMLANVRDDITLNIIMEKPIGSVPVSLFFEDGTMRKSAKDKLGAYLEKKVTVKPAPFSCQHGG